MNKTNYSYSINEMTHFQNQPNSLSPISENYSNNSLCLLKIQ